MKPLSKISPSLLIIFLMSTFYYGIYARASIYYDDTYSVYTDFDAFYLAGKMVKEDQILAIYTPEKFRRAMEEDANQKIYMPWAYPPPFNFLVMAISAIPHPSSYAVFMVFSLSTLLIFTFRLSKNRPELPLLMTCPSIYSTILSGQNSFITTSIIAAFCCLAASGKYKLQSGGILALLIIKPHLSLGSVLMLIISRRSSVIFAFMISTLLIYIISVLAFGASVWTHFLTSLSASGSHLAYGSFPLDRMTSIYSALHATKNLSAGISLTFHLSVAAIVALTVFHSIIAKWHISRILSISVLSTLFFSPYFYDYDTVIALTAFCLVVGDIIKCSTFYERIALYAGSWLMGGWGLISTLFLRSDSHSYNDEVSLGSAGTLCVFVVLYLILWRAEKMDEVQLKWSQETGQPARVRTHNQ